ncbi:MULTISPECIES: phosphoribosyltransferase family protein [Natronolimnohabitans]|uniref:Adenine phosphoribosyltransferase n=1 Tax=Natronolimnohabitans innermongolicus JCM 12255 TaxID=1227499 RepID=L9X1J6_9EURY|nr:MULTISPECIES: phosphoribosyltransferase family protein [Natronolimnohabitans]ELY55634.1 adenine phosphoribosyltransferase [Natronolimnohabitans innermongolicus JCM 12255]MDQ2050236.1 phosphoribosyltransferase family protein [Natronolimnohabitans sp. A-GB9]
MSVKHTELDLEAATEQITAVYESADVTHSGEHATTVNQLTDQLPALQPRTLEAARALLSASGSFNVDKLAVEEDKGLPFGVLIAREYSLPLAVARWYTYEINADRQSAVDIDSEYFSGDLYLNGIEPGDAVAIVDDTISTGGTMIAMIKAIEKAGATVEEAHCIVEKTRKNGVDRVAEETGIEVTTSIAIEIEGNNVNVVDE